MSSYVNNLKNFCLLFINDIHFGDRPKYFYSKTKKLENIRAKFGCKEHVS